MKIGHSVFYSLEHARQEYIRSAEYHPLIAVVFSGLLFVRMAKRAPMQNKLYKELGMSIAAGTVVGAAYPYYYWLKYLDVVDESYTLVKKKFEANPRLAQGLEQDSSRDINKNFGLSQYNDNDIEDDIDFDMANAESIFEGTE